MAEAVLFVELVPTTQGVKRNVEKDLNGSFDQVEKRGTSVFSKIGGLVKGAAIAAGAAAATLTGIAVKGGFERMLKIEDATAKLDGLGHSAESVDAIMESALAAVRGTAFGLDTAATVAASAVAAGIKPGQELEKYLRLTADAATIAGISMDEMGGIINKVTANGRAMTENLNQLQDRGIPILQWLADEYGVTAEAMSKMVSDGKVDAATFRKVIEDNIGGAALRSGETTRGAWANMLAALSRVGVALLDNVFPYFKTTFQGITTLLDNITARIGPFGDKVASLIGLLRSGDFTAEMRELTGWEEDAPVVRAVTTIRDALTGLFDLIVNGDYTSALRDAFNMEEDSPLVIALIAARDAAIELGPQIAGLAGYFSPLAVVLGVLAPLLPTLLPPLVDLARVVLDLVGVVMPVFVELLTDVATIIAGALVAVLPVLVSLLSGLVSVLSGAVQFVGQFSYLLGPLAVAILTGVAAVKAYAVAMALWKTVTATYAAVQSVLIAATYGQVGATYAQAGASKTAAVAQRLLNAAMTANPIGIIITAITALVGGLIWFFTQTELGQEIWSNFMSFLGDAWNNIVTVATTVWEGLASFFTDLWTGISDVVTDVWNGIVSFLTPIFEFIGGLIQFQVDVWKNIFLVFAAVLVTVWNWISDIFTTVWEAIVAFVTPIITAIVDFVVAYFTMLFEFWSGIWNAVSGFFTSIWQGILDFLIPIVLSVMMAVQGPIQTLAEWWNGVWSSISEFFSGIWNGMVNAVSGAIGQIGGFVGGIFDTVMGALGNVGSWLVDAGGDLIRGFWEGITGMGDWLLKQITGFFDGVVGWAKDTLGIQSPSKVFRMEVGRQVGAGVALGFEDSEESVQYALEAMLPTPDLAGYDPAWRAATSSGVASNARTEGNGSTIIINPQPRQSEEEIGYAAARYNAREAARRVPR